MILDNQQKAHLHSGLFASNSNLKRFQDWLLDLIFPTSCHGCGRVDTRWCHICLNELNAVPVYATHLTSQTLSDLCATGHHRGKLQQSIQALKYYQTPFLANPLALRLVQAIEIKEWTFDTIIPVPLFADREQKRGYNQAYLLSQQVASMTTTLCQPELLIRQRNTPHQVGLSASERRDNVKNAFRATASVAGLSILIIDDVVTTGSTLDACASALFEAGASAVYAITVSHG